MLLIHLILKQKEMSLINLILTWPANCVIVYTNVANQDAIFKITETNLYVPVVTLSTQDNTKLLTQLKLCFKWEISLNKYLSKPELVRQKSKFKLFSWTNLLF